MRTVTQIIYWPGQDTLACDKHAEKIKALAKVLGFEVSSAAYFGVGGCPNCRNEEEKKKV